MQNIFDAVLGTRYARAERNVRSEDYARLEAREAKAERGEENAATAYQREMENDPAAEYMFGGYFTPANMEPEEHAALNAALRGNDDASAAAAFNILRKYVRQHARDVAEFKAH